MKLVYKKYLKTTALVWAGSFLLFFLVHVFVLTPQNNAKKLVRKQLEEKKQVCETALSSRQESTRLQLNKQLEDLHNRLDDFVIDFEESANLTFDISKISNEQEVGSFSITRSKDDDKSQEKTGSKHLSTDGIKISFTSGFNQFTAVLNALERNQPVVFIDKFTIVRSDRSVAGHRVNMDLKVFVRKRQNS